MGLPGAGLSGGPGNSVRRRNQGSGLPTERGGDALGGVGGEVPGATGLETELSVEAKTEPATNITDRSYVTYESLTDPKFIEVAKKACPSLEGLRPLDTTSNEVYKSNTSYDRLLCMEGMRGTGVF